MNYQKSFTVAAPCPFWLLLAGSVAGADNPDSSQSRAALEAEISSQATAALWTKISFAASGLMVPRIEVKTTIKDESDKEGTYFSFVVFNLIVDGREDPRFVYGSVGLATTISEARQIAYKEWSAMFLPTFIRALALVSDHVDENSLRVYPSIIMCRGDSPLPLAKDQGSDILLFVRPYISLVAGSLSHGTNFMRDAHVLLVTMAVDQTGKTEGYCLFNGQDRPLSADAKAIGLPPTGSTYIIKQLFIFRAAKLYEQP